MPRASRSYCTFFDSALADAMVASGLSDLPSFLVTVAPTDYRYSDGGCTSNFPVPASNIFLESNSRLRVQSGFSTYVKFTF